jgi:hypothetical protein
MRKKTGGKGFSRLISLGLFLLLAFSAYKVYDHSRAFNVVQVSYLDGDYRPVNLPFIAGDGVFSVNFTTNRETLGLNFFARDCITWASLNGEVFLETDCTPCAHCGGISGQGSFTAGEYNILALRVVNLGRLPYFFVENSDTGFIWRLTLILSVLGLTYSIILFAGGKCWEDIIPPIKKRLVRDKALYAMLLVALILQLTLAPHVQRSRDLENGMMQAENLLHKRDLNLARLDPDYKSYNEHEYMSKPPGAYLYFFTLLRLLFGFTHVYTQVLVKVPAILAHLLLGYLIWDMLEGRVREGIRPIFTAAYLFNPIVLMMVAGLGKHDPLPVALLILGLKCFDKRFGLFFGLSLVTKQFAGFMTPWLLFRRKGVYHLLVAGLVFALMTSPFLLNDPVTFIDRLIRTHSEKDPKGISWMTGLEEWGIVDALALSKYFLLAYFMILFIVGWRVRLSGFEAVLFTYSLFIPFSKVVYEQYVYWTLPFLLLLAAWRGSVLYGLGYVVGSVAMVLAMYEGHFALESMMLEAGVLIAIFYSIVCVKILLDSRKM